VEAAMDHAEVAGARMIGGGMGGCTINLIRHEAVQEVTERVSEAYSKVMEKKLSALPVEIAGGASVIRTSTASPVAVLT